jgi:hypothetical protein
MTRELKDVVATGLTALAVLAFLATHEGWGVWLVGDSRRWAAAAITLLGVATCGLGAPNTAPEWAVRRTRRGHAAGGEYVRRGRGFSPLG